MPACRHSRSSLLGEPSARGKIPITMHGRAEQGARNTSRSQRNPLPECLLGQCDCAVASELHSIFEASKAVDEVRPDLTKLVLRLFDCLQYLMQKGLILDADELGIALGAVFDFCLSLLYAERCTATQWLYCPREPAASFYTYVKSCPRCGRVENIPPVAHKPPSDTIGRYTTLCRTAILAEIFRRTRNGWNARIITTARGEVDVILFSPQKVVLCEVKASPLVAFPLYAVNEEPLDTEVEGEVRIVDTHRATDITNWKRRPISIFLFGIDRSIPLRANRKGDKVTFIPALLRRKRGDLAEDMQEVINLWKQMLSGYSDRWVREGQQHLRWFTFGCGSGVDDSKNAPGLDRTDDIKKGLYQSLKLTARYRTACSRQRVKIGLLSNIHPAIHYSEYLQDFEDAVWTHANLLENIESLPEWKRVRLSDLSPFYDMLFTLTKSWFRDEELEAALSLQTLHKALGGKR